MAVLVSVNNLTDFKVSSIFVRRIIKSVFLNEGVKSAEISVAFLGEDEIRNINKEYRNKDKATDVLSFLLDKDNMIGEIIICPTKVKGELSEVLIHGSLHLLGYDHEKSKKERELMRAKEDFYSF
ncbi:MAG: rRNA maturation RNase YbeY [Candidatus Pacebacteria bacterium]|nr:rRNA maturation RNase YbeY [Candidatus Paceibacterota bacterium]